MASSRLRSGGGFFFANYWAVRAFFTSSAFEEDRKVRLRLAGFGESPQTKRYGKGSGSRLR